MNHVSSFAKLLVLSVVCALTGHAALAASCSQTRTISVPWTIQVAPQTTTVAGAGFFNSFPIFGSDETSQNYSASLLHNAPTTICGGPVPALPTSVDLSAMIEWGGILGQDSTASGATASLDLTIAGTSVALSDQVMTDNNLFTRFFYETSTYDFTVNVDSIFSVDGALSVGDIVRDNIFQWALVLQGFRVTLDPYETTGVVEYLVPVPLPTPILLGASAFALLGAIRLNRRNERI